MHWCEGWTIKKAEHQRTDAFKLWCWIRLLRAPWTARRTNQSILKEINPEYSMEGLMLELKLQYFGHLIQRADSLEKTLMLRKIEGRRRKRQQRMRWLDDIIDLMDMSLSKLREMAKDRKAWWAAAVHGVAKSQTQLSNWATTMHVWVFDLPCHLQSLQKWLPSIDALTKVIQGLSWCFIVTFWNRAGTCSPSPSCPLPAFCLWKTLLKE